MLCSRKLTRQLRRLVKNKMLCMFFKNLWSWLFQVLLKDRRYCDIRSSIKAISVESENESGLRSRKNKVRRFAECSTTYNIHFHFIYLSLFDLFLFLYIDFLAKSDLNTCKSLLYCCYFTKRKLCEFCTIHFNMSSKPCHHNRSNKMKKQK